MIKLLILYILLEERTSMNKFEYRQVYLDKF